MKKSVILINIIIIVLIISGVSYALWSLTFTQNSENVINSTCLKLSFDSINDGISLSDALPITDDEGNSLKPYTFRITNTCKEETFYQINLEQMLLNTKELPLKYIKVTLDENEPNIITNFTSVDPSLENAKEAYKLTSGVLKEKESKEYDLRLWIDKNMPLNDATSEASFLSKISVIATMDLDHDIENEITFEITNTKQEDNSEEIEVKVNSKDYLLNAYTFSNNKQTEDEIKTFSNWNLILPEAKETILKKTFTENGNYYLYIKDEKGNIKEYKIEIKLIDKEGPEILSVSVNEEWARENKIIINTKDESGIIGYAITTTQTNPIEFIEIEETLETQIEYTVTENNTYYIWLIDKYRNMTQQSIVIDKIDQINPTLSYEIESSKKGEEDWYQELNLKFTGNDIESGIKEAKYCITTNDSCDPEKNIEVINNSFIIPFESNKNAQKICSEVNDRALNKSEILCSDLYKFDNTIPTNSFTVKLEGNTVTIDSSNSSDEHSGIKKILYKINSNGDYQESNIFPNLENGNFTFTVLVEDQAGNQNIKESEMIHIDHPDTSAPTIEYLIDDNSITGNNGWYKNLILKAKIRDQSEIKETKYCITTNENCTPNVLVALNNKEYIYTFLNNSKAQRICMQSTDIKGYQSEIICSENYKVDGEAPTAKITYNTQINSITLNGANSSDEHSGIDSYAFQKDGGYWYPSASTYNFTYLNEKTYKMALKVTDKAGNFSIKEIEITLVYPLLNNYIKTITPVTIGTGLYKDEHSNANITYTTDATAIQNLKQTEYRYAGANPDNYIEFNNEQWRIIGLVNTPEGQRVKLVRNESIGSYSWDTSDATINYGGGINEWSTSKMKELLNSGAYYEARDGVCYNWTNNANTTCEFYNTGLYYMAKNMIDTVTWNTGSNEIESYNSTGIHNFYDFYNIERSNNTGKSCSGTSCEDTVEHKTTWKGQVGLIYPSDYGYATSGDINRESCLDLYLTDWKNNSYCYIHNWMYKTEKQWTLTPYKRASSSSSVLLVNRDGYIDVSGAYEALGIYPTIYLKPTVKVIGGSGREYSPYELSAT